MGASLLKYRCMGWDVVEVYMRILVVDCWSMYMYVSGAIIKLACTDDAVPIVM